MLRKDVKRFGKIECVQINLHRSIAPSSVLDKVFKRDSLKLAFIQEPSFGKGKIKGLAGGKLLYGTADIDRPRAALMLSGDLKYLPLTTFISKDMAAALIRVDTLKGSAMQFVAASVYLDYNAHEIPDSLKNLISYCQAQNYQLVIGCDANSHHTMWGSSDINLNGENLLEFINSSRLAIMNKGNIPTFENNVRKEVIDVTLCTELFSTKIVNWHVSDEPSLSDHKQIRFEVLTHALIVQKYRNPKSTDWTLYHSCLSQKLGSIGNEIANVNDLESASVKITEAIRSSYQSSCPERIRKTNRDVPWWNNNLTKLRSNTRKLFNKAKVTNDWTLYKQNLSEYNREIRKAKRESWKKFCNEISQVADSAKVHKTLAKDHTNCIGLVQRLEMVQAQTTLLKV